MACRLICNVRKSDSLSPHLKDFHWLKVKEHITCKIAVLVFKCVEGSAPPYLISLLTFDHGKSDMHSAATEKLPVIRVNNQFTLQFSFSAAGPHIWNSLLVDIRKSSSLDVFKKHLKTFLFSQPCDIELIFYLFCLF